MASPEECAQAVDAVRGAMVDLFHQGGSTSLVPDSTSRKRLGAEGYALVQRLRERVRGAREGVAPLYTYFLACDTLKSTLNKSTLNKSTSITPYKSKLLIRVYSH